MINTVYYGNRLSKVASHREACNCVFNVLDDANTMNVLRDIVGCWRRNEGYKELYCVNRNTCSYLNTTYTGSNSGIKSIQSLGVFIDEMLKKTVKQVSMYKVKGCRNLEEYCAVIKEQPVYSLTVILVKEPIVDEDTIIKIRQLLTYSRVTGSYIAIVSYNVDLPESIRVVMDYVYTVMDDTVRVDKARFDDTGEYPICLGMNRVWADFKNESLNNSIFWDCLCGQALHWT